MQEVMVVMAAVAMEVSIVSCGDYVEHILYAYTVGVLLCVVSNGMYTCNHEHDACMHSPPTNPPEEWWDLPSVFRDLLTWFSDFVKCFTA